MSEDQKHWDGKDAFKKPALISATTVRRKAVTMMIMIVMIVMMMQNIHCLMLECITNVTLWSGRDMKAWDREKEVEVEGKAAKPLWEEGFNEIDSSFLKRESGPLFIKLLSTIVELKWNKKMLKFCYFCFYSLEPFIIWLLEVSVLECLHMLWPVRKNKH